MESQVVVKQCTGRCCVHFTQPPLKTAFCTTMVQYQNQEVGMYSLLSSLELCHFYAHLLVIVYGVYGICVALCNLITCIASGNHHCNQDT